MIRENFLYMIFGIILLASSCTDPWDARFDNSKVADKTVWQLLSENNSYSQFIGLLEETGIDTVLQRNTAFTVFAVPGEYFPDLSGYSIKEKTSMATYHISNFILYSGNIKNGMALKTLNGKRLSFTISGSDIIVNDESELLLTDLIATNGVIHEINGIQHVRPNLLEYIYSEDEYSYIADFFAQGTELAFDRQNSIPIGINEDGLTIYDSIWKQSNEFFTTTADLGSEDKQYTFFLASNDLLDTIADGSYKSGYISNIGNFIIDGLIFESDLPGSFEAINGFRLYIDEDNYSVPKKLSNGWVYTLNGFQGIKIPGKITWEVTDISDFDTIRHIRASEFATLYDQMHDIEISDLDGSFINLKYDFDPEALNGDYLKIITANGTRVKIGIKLPDLLPGKYMVSMGGLRRKTTGIDFDAYMNGIKIGTAVNMNGGELLWEIIDIGETTITSEKGNILTIEILNRNNINTRGYIDYLVFEPVN